MSNRDAWPSDPLDPRCPECDGPVSATASYCMHCRVDLPGVDFDVRETATGIDADFADGGAATTGRSDDGGWLHPDGVLDNVTTVGVGIGGGLIAGVVASIALIFALPDLWPFATGLVVWIVAALWISRTRTVFGAVRKAGLLVGGLLAALPVVFASTAHMAENTLGQRVGLMIGVGVFVWPFALVIAVVGYLGGRVRYPDE